MMLAVAALMATFALVHWRNQPTGPEPQPLDTSFSPEPKELLPDPMVPEAAPASRPTHPLSPSPAPHQPAEELAVSTNKLERLTQMRETFRTLAAGDPTSALRAAKQVTDETERETALLTLVAEWTHGELSPPRQRASAIDLYGLEAGLGLEIAKSPELAVLWANELTDGPARTAVLQQTALAMTASDPAAAFALSQQLPEAERHRFSDAIFAGWAANDTSAALQWADQLPDPAERDAAIQAIRSVAPVGIGVALSKQDGYPVVNQLMPGTPAELSGQIRPGDHVLALAQGDNVFVDAQSLSLQDVVQMIRGAPGSLLQLQILAADAPPNSQPRTVSIIRDQIKLKR